MSRAFLFVKDSRVQQSVSWRSLCFSLALSFSEVFVDDQSGLSFSITSFNFYAC
jgi:hypothetical protein